MKKIKLEPINPHDDMTLYDIPVVVRRYRASNVLMHFFLIITTCIPTALIMLFLFVASMGTMDYTFVILFTAFLSVFCVMVGMVARALRSIDQ